LRGDIRLAHLNTTGASGMCGFLPEQFVGLIEAQHEAAQHDQLGVVFEDGFSFNRDLPGFEIEGNPFSSALGESFGWV
jgi:hypothetical protein